MVCKGEGISVRVEGKISCKLAFKFQLALTLYQLPLLISGITTPYKSHTFRPRHAMASYLAETSNFAPSSSTCRTSLQ